MRIILALTVLSFFALTYALFRCEGDETCDVDDDDYKEVGI